MRQNTVPTRDVEGLIELLRYLRSPNGCPWDRAQTNSSLVAYLLEEAYEAADAIKQGTGYKTCEELGDLLLQIAFYSVIAEENNQFDFGDIVLALTRKLIRRHPHIFGDDKAGTVAAVRGVWKKVKATESSGSEQPKFPPLPGLLLLEKFCGDIDPAQVDNSVIRQLVVLVQQAVREGRCLEAEVRCFLEKSSLSSRSLPIDEE